MTEHRAESAMILSGAGTRLRPPIHPRTDPARTSAPGLDTRPPHPWRRDTVVHQSQSSRSRSRSLSDMTVALVLFAAVAVIVAVRRRR